MEILNGALRFFFSRFFALATSIAELQSVKPASAAPDCVKKSLRLVNCVIECALHEGVVLESNAVRSIQIHVLDHLTHH